MKTRNPSDLPPAVVLPPGRLERLVQSVTKAYRKAHVTSEEFRYCQKRVRRLLALPRASQSRKTRLPEILTPEELARVLERAYGERPRYGLIVRTLFETNRAGRFTARRVQQIVKAVARKAGIEKHIHPHSYRHSMATFLRNQGVPLDVVQLLLGHADPRTTQLYARLSLAPAREEYDRAMAALAARPTTSAHVAKFPHAGRPHQELAVR